MVQIGEMESIYDGINFGKELGQRLLYHLAPNTHERLYNDEGLEYPFLACNIGSGVSIIKFEAPNGQFQRVGGTSLGGSAGYYYQVPLSWE